MIEISESDEGLYIRVNNPLINNKPAVTIYPKTEAWNAQYYPAGIEQEVIQIATVRDMEIQAIPFQARRAIKESMANLVYCKLYNY